MKRKYYEIKGAANGVGEIFIFDFIDMWGVNAKGFVADLKALGDVGQLDIHINSPGGDVFEGNAIYNVLRQHKAKKTVFIDGLAASMASVVAMAGDRIVMPANALMMIHDPSTVAAGTSEDMRKTAETLDKVRDALVGAYATKTGLDPDTIKGLMADETWMTASEAVEWGFADEEAEEVKMAAAYDISKFKNPPEALKAAAAAYNRSTAAGDQERPAADSINPTQEPFMKKEQLLAIAAALGLSVTNAAVLAAVDKAVADKATVEQFIVEAQKLRDPADKPSTVDVTAAVNAALATERTRQADIRATAKTLGVDAHAQGAEIVERLITSGATIDAARAELISAVSRGESETVTVTAGTNRETFDNPQFMRDAMATALAARYSTSVRKTVDDKSPAREFMAHSILDMASDMLRGSGRRVVGRDRIAIVNAALHTTSDFPYLLADAGNKMLLPEYAAANPTYRLIAGEKVFNDFKAHKFLRSGDFPDLLEVGESGEVKRGTISESKEEVTLASYGRIVGVTRQLLINDDLSAFADLAMKAGRRVANWENALVYAELLLGSGLGPTLSDGSRVFATAHANYTSAGTAVNLPVELGKSRALMRKQTGLDGLKLNLTPVYLVIGPDNETAAEQVTTIIQAQQTGNVNPVGPRLTPVVDANITGYGWYLFARPSDAEVLVYGSLPGQTGPRIETKQGWDVEGVELKVMRDFTVGAIDYRGATYNAGTAPS